MIDLSSAQAEKIAVYSGLTTSTAVAEQIRSIEKIGSRMASMDEREALSNGLQTLAEEYDEGWDSGGDSDFDD
jgi:flagellar motor switch protein FliM